MKKHVVIMNAVLWGFLTMSGVPSYVFAQGLGGNTPTAPGGKMTAPTSTTSTGTAATAMNTAAGIHANKKSHVYHLANCPGYTKVSEKNLTTFASEDEAMKSGFHKAKNCPK